MTDLRYAARTLAKTPGFALIVVGLLAAGIAATTVVFSFVDAVLLRPLPVPRSQELVRLVQRIPQAGGTSFAFPYFPHSVYEAMVQRSTTFSAVFGEAPEQVVMSEPAPAEQVQVRLVTPEFFTALGVPALYGRILTAADASEAADAPPAVLSYGFWRKRFGADAHTLGRTMVIHGHPFVIVGVMPPQFNGMSVDTAPDVRIPLRYLPSLAQRSDQTVSNSSLEIAGRLKPGVTRAQAQAECLVIWRNAIEQNWKPGHPDELAHELRLGMELEPMERGISILREHFRLALLVLGVSVGLLQLMLCANLAGLMLARNAERYEEIAVRLALGAPRRRLVRQMFTESVMLALAGVAAGLVIARAAIPLLMRALPPIRDAGTGLLTLSLQVGLDRRVLVFSVAAAVLTVLFFGLAPAIASSRLNLDSVVRGSRSTRAWRGQRRLLVAQVALCTLLLAAAGLLVRTFERLSAANPGFDRDRIVSFTVNPWVSGYSAAQTDALRLALTARVSGLPGVVSVATAERPVMRGSGLKFTIAPAGQKVAPGDNLNASLNSVSPEYFATMGIKVVAGRGFDNGSTSHAKPIMVVVNEAFVRRFFSDINPVGKRFGTPYDPDGMEIMGVVSDAKYRSLREPAPPTVYGKIVNGEDDFVLYARTRMQPESLIRPVRRELAALDPTISFTEVHTLAEEVEESAATERLTAELGTIFGLLAALLAAIGIYGLFAAVVAQRRREIAIRMAVGANRGHVARLIALQVLKITAGGVTAGLAAALFLGPLTRSLLYGITPYDPVSLFAAAGFVVSVAALGAAIPAFRATRIQPAVTLRQVQ